MDEIAGVGIKQEQDVQEISPEHVWLKISPEIIKTDLDNIVKSEDQYCKNYDEDCSNNLPSENGLFLKEEKASLGVAEEHSVNKIDIDEHEFKIDYDQQDVSGQAIFQENAELQTDVIELKQIEKKKKSNRNKTLIGKEKKYKCPYCEYATQYSSYFKLHVSAIHEKANAKVYCCQQCTYKTLHKPNLRRHIRLHEGRAPYECSGCDKSFHQKLNLDNHLFKNHKSLHHLITCRIRCCTFCTYKTILSKDFVRHIVLRHNRDSAEKFQCYKCDYFTLEKRALKTHLMIHSNTRPFLCTLCNKGCNRKKSLDSHILSKHKYNVDLLKGITSKTHQCTLCTLKTVSKSNLQKHMKRMHKLEL